MTTTKMGTLGIGAAGELLVQYRLLKHGIDSARLTTDSGIDLVMYLPGDQVAATIQVKAVQKPGPAGGKGKPALGWRFPHNCPAQWLAFVDLSTDSVWLLTIDRARELAQQHHPNDGRLLYWYVGDDGPPAARRQSHMDNDTIAAVAARLLAGELVTAEGNSL